VAHAGRPDFDENLAGAWTVEPDGGDFKRFAGRKGDGGTNIREISFLALCIGRLSFAPGPSRSASESPAHRACHLLA
jgi:hypothetical protein